MKYKSGLTLITTTGGRPGALALCEGWITRAGFSEPCQWIVIDDGEPAAPPNIGTTVIRPRPAWEPGQNTQSRNLLAALPAIEYDKVLIVEDDDYYPEDYFATQSTLLGAFSLVGEGYTRYYNLKNREWFESFPRSHCSLCQTAFRAELLPIFKSAVESNEKFIDIKFWELARKDRALRGKAKRLKGGSVIGIKGLPGRPGIGAGHRPGGESDPGLIKFREWLGTDWIYYKEFLR